MHLNDAYASAWAHLPQVYITRRTWLVSMNIMSTSLQFETTRQAEVQNNGQTSRAHENSASCTYLSRARIKNI